MIRKEMFKSEIQQIYDDNYQIYGSHRITVGLQRKGIQLSRTYVGRLMKEMGLKSILRKKFIVTTDSKHNYKVAKNVLNRNFQTEELGKVWVSDITYIRKESGWVYLTTMIDLADRKIVGWSLSQDMTVENTVIKAWIHARSQRNITSDFILHSDRGVQYACNKIKGVFSFHRNASQSMSRKGNCWDNAVAESFFKSIKYEWLNRFKFTAFQQAYSSLKKYIDWYNTKRFHSSIGYITPIEKELQLKNNFKQVA
jgi:transposase InsO family protein